MNARSRVLPILLLTFHSWAAITVSSGTDPNSFVLSGKMITPDGILDGKLVIQGSTIACVGPDCTVPLRSNY